MLNPNEGAMLSTLVKKHHRDSTGKHTENTRAMIEAGIHTRAAAEVVPTRTQSDRSLRKIQQACDTWWMRSSDGMNTPLATATMPCNRHANQSSTDKPKSIVRTRSRSSGSTCSPPQSSPAGNMAQAGCWRVKYWRWDVVSAERHEPPRKHSAPRQHYREHATPTMFSGQLDKCYAFVRRGMLYV
jgi:hypothetical protein